jgi:hypothetical protein
MKYVLENELKSTRIIVLVCVPKAEPEWYIVGLSSNTVGVNQVHFGRQNRNSICVQKKIGAYTNSFSRQQSNDTHEFGFKDNQGGYCNKQNYHS